jgi:hypothetical protein
MQSIDIDIAFVNDTDEVKTINLFQNADPTSQQGTNFVFTCPYQAIYVSYFRVKVDGVNHSFYLTGPTTRESVIALLNALAVVTWSIDPSTANNIFTAFSANKTVEEFEITDLAVDESGFPILDENNEPILM